MSKLRLKDIKHIYHKELDVIYGANEVESMFYLLTEAFYGIPKFHLALNPDWSITKSEQQPIFDALDKLKTQVPVQYIIGHTEFYECKIDVDPHVLIPRQETEELVSWVINSVDHQAPLNILDIGTGSGCIAIALAKKLPNTQVYAMDVSKEAIKLAKNNALKNDVDIKFIEHNILSSFQSNTDGIPFKWDIIVSNPPYVRQSEKQSMKSNVLMHEPEIALYVSDDNPLVFYKAICEFAKENLARNGMLFFEINQYLGKSLVSELERNNYINIELKKDISNNFRMIKAIKNNL